MIDFKKYTMSVEPGGLSIDGAVLDDPEWLGETRPVPTGMAMLDALGIYQTRPELWDADTLADRWGWAEVVEVEAMMEFIEDEQRLLSDRSGVDRE